MEGNKIARIGFQTADFRPSRIEGMNEANLTSRMIVRCSHFFHIAPIACRADIHAKPIEISFKKAIAPLRSSSAKAFHRARFSCESREKSDRHVGAANAAFT